MAFCFTLHLLPKVVDIIYAKIGKFVTPFSQKWKYFFYGNFVTSGKFFLLVAILLRDYIYCHKW